jgi:hypothetical protein
MGYKDRAEANAWQWRKYHSNPAHRAKLLLYKAERRRILKRAYRGIIRLAKAGGCELCGERDPDKLTFHHRDPGAKRMCVSTMICIGTYNVKRLQAEIAKCGILCWNCHMKAEILERRKTKGIRQRALPRPAAGTE